MRPKTRSQPATNSASGALPVCLSGIGIHPRLQPSNRYPRLQHRLEPLRTRPYFRQISITESEIHHLETTLFLRLQDISLNESSVREDFIQEGPRHAVALQMADLDRRREAIRKHRSNRGMAIFMDEQRAVYGERNISRMDTVIHTVMQHPSFQYEFDRELQRHKCAKAA